MPEESTDFAGILALLHREGVRFVLIGGLAMMSHGSAHVTQDIDVAYATDSDNVAKLAQALNKVQARLRGVPADLPFILDARKFRNTQNLTLDTALGSLDVLGHVSGAEEFNRLWERALDMEIFGTPVRVASLEDLIAMKRVANRPKDRNHLLELEALRRLTAENTEPPE